MQHFTKAGGLFQVPVVSQAGDYDEEGFWSVPPPTRYESFIKHAMLLAAAAVAPQPKWRATPTLTLTNSEKGERCCKNQGMTSCYEQASGKYYKSLQVYIVYLPFDQLTKPNSLYSLENTNINSPQPIPRSEGATKVGLTLK